MANNEKGVWRTIMGRRVFIGKGDSLHDAMKKSHKFNGDFSKMRKIQRNNPTRISNDLLDRLEKGEVSREEISKAVHRVVKKKDVTERSNDNAENKKKQANEYSDKNEAIAEGYRLQNERKGTTYEVFEKDGKYYVDGGTNESGKFSWKNTSEWYRNNGYNKLPDEDYKKWMDSRNAKEKFMEAATESLKESINEEKKDGQWFIDPYGNRKYLKEGQNMRDAYGLTDKDLEGNGMISPMRGHYTSKDYIRNSPDWNYRYISDFSTKNITNDSFRDMVMELHGYIESDPKTISKEWKKALKAGGTNPRAWLKHKTGWSDAEIIKFKNKYKL